MYLYNNINNIYIYNLLIVNCIIDLDNITLCNIYSVRYKHVLLMWFSIYILIDICHPSLTAQCPGESSFVADSCDDKCFYQCTETENG